jgi:hypothetical protein
MGSELHPIELGRTGPTESIVSIRCLRTALAVAAAMTLAGAALAEARVASPAVDETIHSNTGSVRVVVQDAPSGLQLQPVLDGEVVGDPVTDSVFDLQGVTRGTHELSVMLLDARGHEVARTSPVTFHVWQASRLFRQRVR